ncbi:YjjG family noncanonical pyrimidine nucleotidase [Gaetbulibacter saemankumensis]|uniref:YjjG family noncanonical pyrimidine nucleotidase n=1 Tax=Gaetbulibacter saemankumensis TaxID=311208 RepID=UPI0004003981|nr:YjjG family noncanonical pyrimidine nucleotidase [Gaetbulibacter saemankumensis]
MKISGITDVFFDLDHTLWDFDRNSALAFQKIFRLSKIQVDIDLFLEHYKAINLEYWKLYRNEKIDKESLRLGRLNDAFKALDYHIEPTVVKQLSQDYIAYLTDNNYLYDNTIEILEYLSERYQLHILSNGFHEVQHKKLVKSNIHHYFKTVTNGESVGIKKPNPEIFHYALRQANTTVNKSVMIGDGYEADILGAKSIGMEVVYFDEFNQATDTEIRTIRHLIELKQFL